MLGPVVLELLPSKGHRQQANIKKGFFMTKIFALALLVVGAILVVYGIGASESLASDFSRFFKGTPTNRSIWLMIGGGVLGVAGLAVLLRSSRSQA